MDLNNFFLLFLFGITIPPEISTPAPTKPTLPSLPTISHHPNPQYHPFFRAHICQRGNSYCIPDILSQHRNWINCRDVILKAHVPGMHRDYLDYQQKSYPVDPVNPVHLDFRPGFDSCRLLREHVRAPEKYIKMLINLLLFFTASNP
jgi:hypothetical protein